MDEYIKREDALKLLRGSAVAKYPMSFYMGILASAQELENAPAADVAPVVHGRWLKTQEPLGWHDVDCVECSACHESWIVDEDYGYDFLDFWHYCPNCGARMDGE